MEGTIVMGFVVGTLLFIFFIPTSWIVYRNLNFRVPLKVTYSLTVVPLFIFLMAKNYFFVANHFPKLIDFFGSIPDAQKSSKGGSIIAFLITCPFSFIGCYVWYKIHDLLDKKIFSTATSHQTTITEQNDESENERKFFQVKWMSYFIVALLANLFIGLNLLNSF